MTNKAIHLSVLCLHYIRNLAAIGGKRFAVSNLFATSFTDGGKLLFTFYAKKSPS